jgi:hypothetical protein
MQSRSPAPFQGFEDVLREFADLGANQEILTWHGEPFRFGERWRERIGSAPSMVDVHTDRLGAHRLLCLDLGEVFGEGTFHRRALGLDASLFGLEGREVPLGFNLGGELLAFRLDFCIRSLELLSARLGVGRIGNRTGKVCRIGCHGLAGGTFEGGEFVGGLAHFRL